MILGRDFLLGFLTLIILMALATVINIVVVHNNGTPSDLPEIVSTNTGSGTSYQAKISNNPEPNRANNLNRLRAELELEQN